MSNQSAVDAKAIRGQDPQCLIEKIIRTRIYDCRYWKEECFGLSIETLLEKATKLQYVGGTYGNQVPTPFLCLLLKLLALQPEREILMEFLNSDDYKYLKALTAMYIRLTFGHEDIYRLLEPVYNDFRKLRIKLKDGSYSLTYLDEFVDNLLVEDRFLDVKLPFLLKRHVLEERGVLDERATFIPEDEIPDSNTSGDSDGEEKDSYSSKRLKLKDPKKESAPSRDDYDKGERTRTGAQSLSIEETNSLRAKLGLKPLK